MQTSRPLCASISSLFGLSHQAWQYRCSSVACHMPAGERGRLVINVLFVRLFPRGLEQEGPLPCLCWGLDGLRGEDAGLYPSKGRHREGSRSDWCILSMTLASLVILISSPSLLSLLFYSPGRRVAGAGQGPGDKTPLWQLSCTLEGIRDPLLISCLVECLMPHATEQTKSVRS